MSEEEFEFFWGGYFSNWYPSEFTVNGNTFNCGEQYMMAEKAITFNDLVSLKDIMDEKSPAQQKAIGRQVRNFDAEVWTNVCYDLVRVGLYEKFNQNPELKEYLLSKKGVTIVEASPYDRIWGIGYGADDPNILKERDKWGQNILGEMLMDIRDEMLKEE
jgi:ribA/ribD-fused uncharacterized protein